MASRIEQLIRAEIRSLSSYHVPDSTGMIKLDAMENPYTWPESIKSEWLELLAEVAVNRYPDAGCQQLEAITRQAMYVPDHLGVMFGNGSDELIQIICMALADNRRTHSRTSNTILGLEPGFIMYRMVAAFVGMDYAGVPLTTDFALQLDLTLATMQQTKPAVIFIAYPNNPTGNLFDEQMLIQIIEQAPGLIVIDEAYQPFAQKTFLDKIAQYEHLLVMRTVSKMGLAGLRLGYLVGHFAWINEFNKLRLPYNINTLTQACAGFALRHMDELNHQAQLIRAARSTLYADLQAIQGLTVYPSAANFILFRTLQNRANAIHAALCKQKILIKNLSHANTLLQDCLRVTVSTPIENDAFLAALRVAMVL